MRVLHIYSGNFYGGVESLLLTFARSRDLCPGMQPSYALSFEGKLSADLARTGVPVYQLGAVRASLPLTVIEARRRLRSLLGRERFDVVICHSPWPHLIFAPAVRASGTPLVFWLHDAAEGKHWSERWARRTPPDLAITNSEFTQKTLPNIHPGVRGAIVRTPVAVPDSHWTYGQLASARAELGASPTDVVIVQPSRMEEWKGHRLHLEALALLKDVPNWVCWMVGKPQRPYEQRYFGGLKDQAARLGLEGRVRFPGWVPDLGKLLAAAQIHCQPNTGPEPLGLTFLEAMAARLPVVTTALGGALELVDESCGVLTPPGDAAALASALGGLIADEARRSKLGAAGPARVRRLCDPELQLNLLSRALRPLARGSAAA